MCAYAVCIWTGRQADRRERVRETERERERTKRVPFLTDGSRKS